MMATPEWSGEQHCLCVGLSFMVSLILWWIYQRALYSTDQMHWASPVVSPACFSETAPYVALSLGLSLAPTQLWVQRCKSKQKRASANRAGTCLFLCACMTLWATICGGFMPLIPVANTPSLCACSKPGTAREGHINGQVISFVALMLWINAGAFGL